MSKSKHNWSMDVVYNWERKNPKWEATEVSERLWIGGTPHTDVVVKPGSLTNPWSPSVTSDLFDACLTLTPIAGPVGHEVVELRVPLIDKKGAQVDIELVQEAVKWVVDKHKDNKKVLVRCHAGLNRSGLIVVPVLTFIEPSLSFNDALQRVRTLRHKLVLNRPEFLEVAKKVARAGS